ncbi:hypothetical protein sync_0840 [Synechococcus sp. CC9311]|nr:hypothetical protein sync_0840 [Synechococcus sp. CC9311]
MAAIIAIDLTAEYSPAPPRAGVVYCLLNSSKAETALPERFHRQS